MPEGTNYDLVLLSAIHRWVLTKPGKRWVTHIDVQPQFGWVHSLTEQGFVFEFGLNVGLSETFFLQPNRYLTFTMGSGPHFTNVTTTRQAQGYIFSDNWLLSYTETVEWFDRPLDLSLILGFRHISNAGLNSPNGGLNDYIFGFAVMSRQ